MRGPVKPVKGTPDNSAGVVPLGSWVSRLGSPAIGTLGGDAVV